MDSCLRFLSIPRALGKRKIISNRNPDFDYSCTLIDLCCTEMSEDRGQGQGQGQPVNRGQAMGTSTSTSRGISSPADRATLAERERIELERERERPPQPLQERFRVPGQEVKYVKGLGPAFIHGRTGTLYVFDQVRDRFVNSIGYEYQGFWATECSVDCMNYDPQHPNVFLTLPNEITQIPRDARETQWFLYKANWPNVTQPLSSTTFFSTPALSVTAAIAPQAQMQPCGQGWAGQTPSVFTHAFQPSYQMGYGMAGYQGQLYQNPFQTQMQIPFQRGMQQAVQPGLPAIIQQERQTNIQQGMSSTSQQRGMNNKDKRTENRK